jgi:hypothetical protein
VQSKATLLVVFVSGVEQVGCVDDWVEIAHVPGRLAKPKVG